MKGVVKVLYFQCFLTFYCNHAFQILYPQIEQTCRSGCFLVKDKIILELPKENYPETFENMLELHRKIYVRVSWQWRRMLDASKLSKTPLAFANFRKYFGATLKKGAAQVPTYLRRYTIFDYGVRASSIHQRCCMRKGVVWKKLQLQLYLKRDWRRCFPMNFVKFRLLV